MSYERQFKTTEQDPCNICGKTLREQMKGCNEITCYRQFLQKSHETKLEYPVIGQKVIFKKMVSSNPGASHGDIRTIKAILPYPCASEEGIKAKILWFEEDTEKTTFTQVKCWWCSPKEVTKESSNYFNLHTLPIKGQLHLDSEWQPL